MKCNVPNRWLWAEGVLNLQAGAYGSSPDVLGDIGGRNDQLSKGHVVVGNENLQHSNERGQ